MRIDVSGLISPTSGGDSGNHLFAYLRDCCVDRCLVANRDLLSADAERDLDAPSEAYGNAAALEFAKRNPGLSALYVVTRRSLESNATVFLGAMSSEPFAGAFFAPLLHRFDPLDEGLAPYWQTLARRKRPALFLSGPKSTTLIQRILTLSRQHPSISFVLCGAMRDGVRDAAMSAVAKSREKGEGQLLLDCSYADGRQIVNCIRAVGVDRVLYGSLAPIHAASHAERRGEAIAYLSQTLPEDAFHKLMGINAARIFGLSTATQAA